MEFELPEELRMFKDSLRRFVNNELIPIERQTLTTEGEEIKPEFLGKLQQRAKDLGIWMMEVPEEYGGPGLSLLQRTIVTEELSRTIALPARGEGITGPSVRHILFTLKGELREKYLMPVLRGEKKVAFAQTEPDAGSDPGGMRTTAVKDGNHYVINGTKRFITGANKAHFMQLMAATDRAKGSHGGISCFLVDMDTPGVKLGTSYQTMMGDRPWEIILDNVRVPAENLVGEEGERLRVWRRSGSAPAASSTARARSASPSAAWKWRRPTPSSARPSAGRSPTGRRSSGSSRTCISSCRRRGCWSTRRRPGSTPARTRAKTATSASIMPTRWRSAPPTNACRCTAASRSPPTCRSRSSGASSAATASPKAPAR